MVTPAGGAGTVTLGPLGPCCFEALPLHYDADPGETNDVQIFMTVFGDGSPSGTWIVVDNGASVTAGSGCGGGPDNDQLWARDGFKDVVRGGSGHRSGSP